MKSFRNNKRRISKWNAITILDDDNNIHSYFELDEYGRLRKKFQKQKPRNLSLFMNQAMAKSENSELSDQKEQFISEESSSQENLFDFSNIQTLMGNSKDQDQKYSSYFEGSNSSEPINLISSKSLTDSEFSDLFVSTSLIGDTQWCIDYVTSHLLVI